MRNGRKENEIRPIRMIPNFIPSADGSVLIECGNTRVICTAMVEERVPPFVLGTGRGWVTAEYAMLPGSTQTRKQRERGKADGRSTEIQRLIGRSLRSVVDLSRLGERTVYLDCDVIQADGGTRTASITGAFVALSLAVDKMLSDGTLECSPIRDHVAAVSCGIVDQQPMLDLCYAEDSTAQVDMNFVMTGAGDFVEIQGTGEERPFKKEELDKLMGLAAGGIQELIAIQKRALEEYKNSRKEENR